MENEYREPLVLEEFFHGVADHDEGNQPPRLTSWSYDKGRAFGARVPPCCRGAKDYSLFTVMGCPHERLRKVAALLAEMAAQPPRNAR